MLRWDAYLEKVDISIRQVFLQWSASQPLSISRMVEDQQYTVFDVKFLENLSELLECQLHDPWQSNAEQNWLNHQEH